MKKWLLPLLMTFSFLFLDLNVSFAQGEFLTNKIDVAVNSYGRIRIYSLPEDTKQVERISILVGTGADAVFDYQNDQDIEDSTRLVDNPTWSDYEIYGSYNNNYSALPPNVLVKQYVYGWTDESFIIVKYVVTNREASAQSAIFGLDYIPQIQDSLGMDTVKYSTTDNIVDTYKDDHVGIKILSDNIVSLKMFEYYDNYYEDTSYYNWLSSGTIDSLLSTSVDDPVIVSGIAAQNLNPGDSLTVYAAAAYGTTREEMTASIAKAQAKYNTLTDVQYESNNIPSKFNLAQNYPNPFNPSTRISFSIPNQTFVTLRIYNLLGQEISTLTNSELAPGKYTYDFNALNLTSGIYFYSLKAGNFSSTKKMILMK